MTYITMPLIGEVGNLGSQIQQYFSIKAIANSNNKKLVFPRSSLSKGHGFKFIKLLKLNIEIVEDSAINNFMFVNIDNNVIIDERVFNLNPNINYAFMGRFDLYTYWYNKIKEIVDNVEFNDVLLEESKSKLLKIKNTTKTISLHVRRGDYLLPQHHFYTKLDVDYYDRALKQIKNLTDYQLLIFSNDIPWCKTNLSGLHNNISYIDKNTDYIDLCMMSLCDHNIIANSSFSWWGAYLNKNINKIVVCSKNYMDIHELSHIINGNYYPKEWIAI
jgi:hypothetical protein